jgi:hypothetical protein
VNNHSVSADLTGWLGQFQRDCDAAIADLTQVCSSATQNTTYQQQIENYRFGVARIILEKPEELSAVAPERAARTCFLNVIGKYIGFLDKLIAVQRLTHVDIEYEIHSMEELQAFVNNRFEREAAKVARDTSLSNPKKIDCFQNASGYARDTSKAYFQLRRALEHHNDVPDSDLVIPTQRIGFLAGANEIKTLGITLAKGDALSAKMFHEELKLAKGKKITLTPQNAYDLVFTMRMVLGPEIFRSHVETP